MVMITIVPDEPEAIIEFNQKLVFQNHDMFRGSIIQDFKNSKLKLWAFLRWSFEVRRGVFKSKRYFKKINRDPELWVSIPGVDGTDNIYMDWIKEEGIKCDNTLWYNYTSETTCAFVFRKKEDAVAFKLRWV